MPPYELIRILADRNEHLAETKADVDESGNENRSQNPVDKEVLPPRYKTRRVQSHYSKDEYCLCANRDEEGQASQRFNPVCIPGAPIEGVFLQKTMSDVLTKMDFHAMILLLTMFIKVTAP